MAVKDELATELEKQVRGEIVLPNDPGYDAARKVYNAMIDKRPAMIVRAVDVADVIAAVNFGRAEGMDIAIRGGGHNGAGLALVDDGLVIDLSAMRSVNVHPEAKTATVSGGCTLGDVDHATHAFGLAVPGGIVSTTGIGGLTLGGGEGYLTRKYGLTIDNLLSVDMVLSDGSFVTADESNHEDLFWAIRGGGGNFGVATSFNFALHPVSTVNGGLTFWPIEQATEVLQWYREFMPSSPEELCGFFAFLSVPPADPFPEELHNRTVCGIVWCYTGDEDPAGVFAPVQETGSPLMHFIAPMPYTAMQSMFDGLYPTGMQWYWRGDFFDRITDEAIEALIQYGSNLPTGLSSIHLYPIDGAPNRVDKKATAWNFRDAVWSGVIIGIDPDPSNKEKITEWTINYYDALHPHSMGAAYVNFMMEEGQERVKSTYGANYDRLAKIKGKYDPDNLFHVNQNILPG
jgi:FAD/FMN-containing dehydrogenase